jgi:hypothetical protein
MLADRIEFSIKEGTYAAKSQMLAAENETPRGCRPFAGHKAAQVQIADIADQSLNPGKAEILEATLCDPTSYFFFAGLGVNRRWCTARNVGKFPVAGSRSSHLVAVGHSKQHHSVENLTA